MNDELNVQGTEQNISEDQSERTGAVQNNREEVKTFTQEEVDKIVEKRLNRERRKYSSLLNGEDPREIEFADREKAVELKELQIEAKATLTEKGLPLEILEHLNYTDKESCNKSIEAFETAVNAAVQKHIGSILCGGKPPRKAGPNSLEEPVDPLHSIFCRTK